MAATASAIPTTEYPHRLFVYGTLKRGFYNHRVYLQHAEQSKAAKYLGTATTCNRYSMKIVGERCVPALFEEPAETAIQGEVYAITDSVLEAMDILEGVASGHYFRKRHDVILEEERISCFVYCQNHKEGVDLSNEPSYSDYTEELHTKYSPRSKVPNSSILNLLMK